MYSGGEGKNLRKLVLLFYDLCYQSLARPLIFKAFSPQEAHDRVLEFLCWCDSREDLQPLLSAIHNLLFEKREIEVGGVVLDSPFILAAGFVKGRGFENEDSALACAGENIIPGWRTLPALVGAVEMGSFTRWPRMGNSGTVLWRDEATHSTQNRIGLKNPGARAAAVFLARKSHHWGQVGINIAVSPGVTDPDQEQAEVLDSLALFTSHGVIPAWFTLNLSCPNTEDDPGGNQTEEKARRLCGAVVEFLRPHQRPLWVKIGPDLADEQILKLMSAFAGVGVRAVVATNTLAKPTPEDNHLTGGLGGGRLHAHAVRVAGLLAAEKKRRGYKVDVIGCGGVWNRSTYYDFVRVGVSVVQYWSALIYRGPLAAAVIR